MKEKRSFLSMIGNEREDFKSLNQILQNDIKSEEKSISKRSLNFKTENRKTVFQSARTSMQTILVIDLSEVSKFYA